MILDPAPPDVAGLLSALRMRPRPQRTALCTMLAGWRDEAAGDMPRVAEVFAAVLDLACAVRDEETATVNRMEMDLLFPGDSPGDVR